MISALVLVLLARFASTDELEIQLVDDAGLPVAGAEVFLQAFVNGVDRRPDPLANPVLCEQWLRQQRRAQADERGRLVLHASDRPAAILAVHDELRGFASLEGSPRPLRIVLGEPTGFDILVRDHAGRPCPDVCVALLHGVSESPRQFARTDAQGLARLGQGLGWYGKEEWSRWPLHVRAFGAVSSPAWTDVERAIESGRVELRLPPTATAEIHLVATDPSFLEGAWYLLEPETMPRESDGHEWKHAVWDDRWAPVPTGATSLSIPRLGLAGAGLRFVLSGPHILEVRGEVILSPTQEGEQVRRWLDVVGILRTKGRLLDPSGRPAANRRWSAAVRRFDALEAEVFSRSFSTDENGDFEQTLRSIPGWSSQLEIRDPDDPARASSLISAEPPLRPERDIGQVRLEPAPVAARGVVLDEIGRPVEGAEVSALLTPSTGSDRPPILGSSPSDEFGRFTLRAHPVPGHALRIEATKEHHFPGDHWAVEIPGASNDPLELRLLRPAFLELPRPRCESNGVSIELQWELRPHPDVPRRPTFQSGPVAYGRTWTSGEWTDPAGLALLPGRYALRLSWRSRPLLEIEEIELGVGTNRPSDLWEMDFDQRTDVHHIVLRDGSGRPLDAARPPELALLGRTETRALRLPAELLRHHDGTWRTECVSASGETPLLYVQAIGFRMYEGAIERLAQIDLQPAIEFRVQARGLPDPAQLREEARLRVHCSGALARLITADPDDPWRFYAQEPGTVQISLCVDEYDADQRLSSTVLEGSPYEVQILDSELEQVIELALGPRARQQIVDLAVRRDDDGPPSD